MREAGAEWNLRHSAISADSHRRLSEVASLRGVLVFASLAHHDASFAESGFPAINVSGRLRASRLPRVRVDEVETGRQAARHLLEAGYERIAAYLDQGTSEFDRLRLKGMREELAAHGLEGRLKTRSTPDSFLSSWQAALEASDAVVTSNANLACRLVGELREARSQTETGRSVGVLNFDDPDTELRWRPDTATGPSFIRLPWEKVGYEAGRRLAAWMESGAAPPADCRVEGHEVVARASTRRIGAVGLIAGAVNQWLEEAYDPRFGIEQIAGAVGFSVSGVSKAYRAAFGLTLGEELARRRQLHACRLLTESHLPVKVIAARCGYGNASAFIAAFRKAEGETPSRWRQRIATRGTGPR